jgi:hypothetical protein
MAEEGRRTAQSAGTGARVWANGVVSLMPAANGFVNCHTGVGGYGGVYEDTKQRHGSLDSDRVVMESICS